MTSTGPDRAADAVEELLRLPTFRALSPDQAARLVARGTLRRLRAGEVLLRQGDRSRTAYVVLAGTARAEVSGQDVGPPIGAGECVGELAALDDVPRAATVVATTPLRVLGLAADSFRATLDEIPALRDDVTRSLSRRLRQVNTVWAQLAVDTDVLLEAYFVLQGSSNPGDRHTGLQAAAELLRGLADERAPEEPHAAPDPLTMLSPAERRVADLVARGLSNAGVAAELFLSEHTVASHLKHIYVKLGFSSRVSLATAVLRGA